MQNREAQSASLLLCGYRKEKRYSTKTQTAKTSVVNMAVS